MIAASKKASGQITVWTALCFLVFLSLYLVCLQSVWMQYQKKQAEQAVEAGLFSLFPNMSRIFLNSMICFAWTHPLGAEESGRMSCAVIFGSLRSTTSRTLQEDLCTVWSFWGSISGVWRV